MPWDGPERRKSLRVPVAARVKFKDGGREEIWFTEDVAEGGLFLRAEKPPFNGTVLELEVALPNVAEVIRLKGEVTWRQEGRGCGIRFLRVTAKVRKILRAFIESAEPRQEAVSSSNQL